MDKGDFLRRQRAQELARQALETGVYVLTRHAKIEMEDEHITTVDIENVVRCGTILEEGELNLPAQAYRYRIHTRAFCVVIEFRDETEFVVVTAWRKKT